MFRTEDQWLDRFDYMDAHWKHDGNIARPHALLTSGLHSDEVFDCELVMEDPIILSEAASDLVELLHRPGINLEKIDRVVGPALGAITLVHEVARNITLRRDLKNPLTKHCLRAYVEKVSEGRVEMMALNRTNVQVSELVLVTDDVLTTSKSTTLTSEAIALAGAYVVPVFAVLVNRSGKTSIRGTPIIALINKQSNVWTHEKCPLCPQGSEAIRPKGQGNWKRLNDVY